MNSWFRTKRCVAYLMGYIISGRVNVDLLARNVALPVAGHDRTEQSRSPESYRSIRVIEADPQFETNDPITASRPRLRLVIQRTALTFLLLATFVAGAGAQRFGVLGGSSAGAESSMTDQPEFKTLQQTWDLIHSEYVDESAIDNSKLLYGAAAGMVDALGDTGHSTFLSPDQADAFQDRHVGRAHWDRRRGRFLDRTTRRRRTDRWLAGRRSRSQAERCDYCRRRRNHRWHVPN